MIKFENKFYGIEVHELLSLINSENLSLFKDINTTGKDIMTNCPFHGADNKPSFGLRKSDGLSHCFTCGYKNNIEGLIKDLGFEYLFDTREQVEEKRKIDLPKKNKGHIKEITNPYKENKTLYWKRRGITKEIKDLFELGYDIKTKDVTFPMKNLSGNIMGFIRRNTLEKKFHVDRGMDKLLYGMYELRLTNYERFDIIIVESNVDALYLWSLGYPALALNGTGSYTQYDLISKMGFRVIYLMLDNDEFGKKGIDRMIKNVPTQKFKIVSYPDGVKDANDMDKNMIYTSLKEVGYFD